MGILEEGNHSGDIVLWGQREYGGEERECKKNEYDKKGREYGKKGKCGKEKGMWNMGKIGVWEGMECRDMVRRTGIKVIWESGRKGNMGERGKR